MRIDFFFGVGSRYSYLASTQLAKLSEATGASFVWRPIFSPELIRRAGGGSASPQAAEYRLRDAKRWARHYGIPYVEPPADVDWRPLALACVAAGALGAAEAFSRLVLHRVHATGVVPSLDEMLNLADSAGLQAAHLARLIDATETFAQHEQNICDALSAGAFGVPTFVLEGGVLIWGQDRLPLLKDCILLGDAP